MKNIVSILGYLILKVRFLLKKKGSKDIQMLITASVTF